MWRFFLLLVVLGQVSAPLPANADGPVGSITEVKGHAVVKRQAQQLDATPSMPVLRSDEIATDAGGGATITLLNGSRLTLGIRPRSSSTKASSPRTNAVNLSFICC